MRRRIGFSGTMLLMKTNGSHISGVWRFRVVTGVTALALAASLLCLPACSQNSNDKDGGVGETNQPSASVSYQAEEDKASEGTSTSSESTSVDETVEIIEVEKHETETKPAVSESASEAVTENDEEVSESSPLESLGQDAKTLYEKGVAAISEFIKHRENAIPQHYALGQMAAATENLAVGVMAVETGPYDYRDGSPTTKVTVAMANTSDKVVVVKASNWNADTTDGLRVNHKFAVYAKNGDKVAESFTIAEVSPKATYTAEIYFDGRLTDVLYEPHWLVSSQNEYLYWNVG